MSDLDRLPGPQGPLPPEPPTFVAVAVDEPRRDPFWTWGDLFIFLFLLIPCFGLAMLITAGALIVLQLKPENMLVSAIPAQFMGYGFSLLVLWLMLKTRYDQPLWRSLGWRWDSWLVLPMLMGGVALAVVVAFSSVLLRTQPVKTPMEELMREPRTALALGFFAVTLGPICEELLFRGLLQPLAVRSFGVAAGILTAALPFALLHGPQYAWSWQHVLLILFAGAMFGYARYRTGSTAMATVMHAGYNFTFFAIVFFQRGLV